MKNIRLKLVPVIVASLCCLMMLSCVPQKKIKYLQDTDGAMPKSLIENSISDYRIQPGDYLYVRLFTMDKEANQIFSDMSGSGQFAYSSEQTIYLNSYIVSDSGYINFPLLGNIRVGGLVVLDIEKKIHDLMLTDVANPGVLVRLVNFKITVLGEVKNPGTFSINQNNITIFQGISMANDLTTYANRGAVKLLRKQGDQTAIINLDLTRKEILSSEYYYLRPGDIIYVEPLKSKQFAFETFPYALILSSLGTLMALLTFVKI